MTKDQFVKEFSQELFEGNGVYFIGSGISVPSKLPDWRSLLKPFANNIGITSLEDKDLPLIAQYIINDNTGNRGPFINAVSKKLRKRCSPNKYHEFISRTNINTIWTTNYDRLIEDVFSNHVIDVKVNDDAISRIVPDSQIEIIKMHGCIFNSTNDEIVITQADYEEYFIKRPATSQRLKIDLLKKSFLFIRYGYGDVNIQNIILEARRLSNNAPRQHYLVTMEKKNEEFKLWCNNLKRFGINFISLKKYDELEQILQSLSLRSRGKSVFVTGSHLPKNAADAKKLGELLASDNELIVLDGQSSGIMRTVVSSFMEKSIIDKKDIRNRLKVFPNPYAAKPEFANDLTLIPLLKQWRLPLLKSAQVLVAFDGKTGTLSEIEKAKELGCFIIPYPKTVKSQIRHCIDDAEIRSKINNVWPDYIKKADAGKLKINDVFSLICKVLNDMVV